MTERQLLRLCQKQDLSAFKMIYEKYEYPLLHTAFRMLGQQQDAEDAVQTTFIKLHRSIHNFKFRSKFSTYLYRILMNVCFDMLRHKNVKTESLSDFEAGFEPEFERRFQLEDAIATLPQQMRACFFLYAVNQFKQREIAEIMNLSEGGVRANIYQAKMKLRALLEPESQENEG